MAPPPPCSGQRHSADAAPRAAPSARRAHRARRGHRPPPGAGRGRPRVPLLHPLRHPPVTRLAAPGPCLVRGCRGGASCRLWRREGAAARRRHLRALRRGLRAPECRLWPRQRLMPRALGRTAGARACVRNEYCPRGVHSVEREPRGRGGARGGRGGLRGHGGPLRVGARAQQHAWQRLERRPLAQRRGHVARGPLDHVRPEPLSCPARYVRA
mmetsp:Transcript_18580/g.49927  ORF Transcript_18580/g.49927 Transcript_18580/m.49927 type:complete len:213 (+) Transcript_18580:251-889(+)